jgi:tRNA dimethylallyltransferase
VDLLNVVAILGHTASGKSEIAEAVATTFGAEIVSVDSMQVYRGMDIGTAKPKPEILERITHHMIDVVDPDADFDVRRFQMDASPIVAAVEGNRSRLVISGGSGLHFRSLVDPMSFAPTDPAIRFELEAMPRDDLQTTLRAIDPEADAIVDMANRRRLVRAIEVHRITGETPSDRHRSPEAEAMRRYVPVVEHLSLGFDAGERAHTRASMRFNSMMDDGLLAEVTAVCARMGRSASQAVGYKELLPVIMGESTLASGIEAAITATNKLIKRQRTYFRRDPRIHWMPWRDDAEERIEDALAFIEKEAMWTS